MKVVVPLTDATKKQMEWMAMIIPNNQNGLSKASLADCFQIKSLSEKRFVKKLGTLNDDVIWQSIK